MTGFRNRRRESPGADAPLPTLPCACANLRRASRAVTQLYDEALRPTGLTISQFTLLQVLVIVGPVTQGGLGRILVLNSTTLTRTLRPLERNGWIRRRSGKDRRERRVELTPRGRARFRRAVPAWKRAQKLLIGRIGRRRWQALDRELSLIAALARRG
jgi:DNA-binding MarR family transcriptional regulator